MTEWVEAPKASVPKPEPLDSAPDIPRVAGGEGMNFNHLIAWLLIGALVAGLAGWIWYATRDRRAHGRARKRHYRDISTRAEERRQAGGSVFIDE